MNECQRGLQGMTRRMMAAVSELALYQVPRGMKSVEAMSQWQFRVCICCALR